MRIISIITAIFLTSACVTTGAIDFGEDTGDTAQLPVWETGQGPVDFDGSDSDTETDTAVDTDTDTDSDSVMTCDYITYPMAAANHVYFYVDGASVHEVGDDIVLATWGVEVSDVCEIPLAQFNANYNVISNLTVRPGVVLVKVNSFPQIYWVAETPGDALHGTARWIETPEVAEAMIGTDWELYIYTVPDLNFPDYYLGIPIRSVGDVVVDQTRITKVSDL